MDEASALDRLWNLAYANMTDTFAAKSEYHRGKKDMAWVLWLEINKLRREASD